MEGLSDCLAEELCEGSDSDGKKFYLVPVSAATGSLHKAVVPQNSSAYLVEEIQLSPDNEPVRNLQLAPAQVRRDLNRIRSSFGEHLGSRVRVLGLLIPSISFPGCSVCRLLWRHLESSEGQL